MGGRRGGAKGSFKQGHTILCPVLLGPGCHPDTTLCHPQGVPWYWIYRQRRLTEGQGQHDFLLTSLKSSPKWLPLFPPMEWRRGWLTSKVRGLQQFRAPLKSHLRTRNGVGQRMHLKDKREQDAEREVPRILFVLWGLGSREMDSIWNIGPLESRLLAQQSLPS